MSSSAAPARPTSRGRALKLWVALLLLIAAGIGLAWIGASPLRGQTTESGVHFRTVKEGSGPTIQPVDGVMIEYEGRLEDGTVFDSSAGRGPTPMIAGQVIPGFAEALSMMQKGGSYKIKIPGNLAYGDQPPQGSPIPPGADLMFDVEVVEVVPNAALMGAAPPVPETQAPPQPGQPQP